MRHRPIDNAKPDDLAPFCLHHRQLIFILAMLCLCFSYTGTQNASGETIRVMSFNLWHGGDAGKQPLTQSVAVIKAAKADIVGLQETNGAAGSNGIRPDRGAEIAKLLGWDYVDQGDRTGIITRFKIVGTTPRKWGAKIRLPSGKFVYHFNVHFASSPYQPYQLLKIPYGDAPFITTEQEAIRFANATRQHSVGAMLAEARAIRNANNAVFITGDFNEPSHLDWTPAAVGAKLCPLKVDWPTTKTVTDAGFVDTFRATYPDPVRNPGMTWTPITSPQDPKDHHDRIDFVFASESKNVKVIATQVIGESKQNAHVVVKPYPSDHRAVVAEIEVN